MTQNPIDKPVGSFPIPLRGVIRTLPAHQIPTDAAYDASNVIIHQGAVRQRPGFGSWPSAASPQQLFTPRPVTHATMYFDAGGNPIPLVFDLQRGLKFESGAWTDITGALLTGTADQRVRTAQITIGSPPVTNVYITNGVDIPRLWVNTGPWTTLTGAPSFTDVCVAMDRIVGILPPFRIKWGEQADLSRWPEANARNLADTAGDRTAPLIAISGRGDNGVIIYRQDSIWTGTPSGRETSAAIFKWTLRVIKEGPANPAAKVTVDGWDYYMTINGRIARYDGGSQHEWIGDGLWPAIQAEVDTTNAANTSAWYDPMTRTVNFAYPRLGDLNQCKGLVVVNLPYPEHGIDQIACWPGSIGYAVFAATQYMLSDKKDQALVIVFHTDTVSYVVFKYELDQSDNNQPLESFVQSPLLPMPGLRTHRLEALECLLERGAGYGTCELNPTVSNTLDVPGGTLIVPGSTVNLNQAPVYDLHGIDARGRYMGLKLSWDHDSKVRYSGAILGARAV